MKRLLPLLALAAVACTEPNPAYDPNPVALGECRAGVEVGETISEFERPEKLDVLFVVDGSGDVEDLQQVLSDSVSEFLGTLNLLALDTHVAVATTDASGEAQLARPGRLADGCASNSTVVAKSTDSNWISATRCNVFQGGQSGSGFDQPLRVVERLVDAGAGQEFFRADARLLVVIVTKDDDCSSEDPLSGIPRDVCANNPDLVDVGDTIDAWRASRLTTDSFALAVIAGPPSDQERMDRRPVCSSTVGSVFPANRLFRATELLGDGGYFSTACTDDIAPWLISIGKDFAANGTATFCPGAELAHEPLSVVLFDGEDQEEVRLGEGYRYLGSTDSCENGAVQFAASSLRGIDEISLEYCSESSQP